MKKLIVVLTLLVSSLAYANKTFHSNLGEVEMKDCECKTCLTENGVCVRTQTNAERSIPDKGKQSSPKKGKLGAAGATKS